MSMCDSSTSNSFTGSEEWIWKLVAKAIETIGNRQEDYNKTRGVKKQGERDICLLRTLSDDQHVWLTEMTLSDDDDDDDG